MPRPKLPEGKAKSECVLIRLTRQQYEQMLKKALQTNQPLAAWAREALERAARF